MENKAHDVYRALSDYVNCGGSAKEIINEFSHDHRFLQSEVFRIALGIVACCSDPNYGYDGRNEGAHMLASKIAEAVPEIKDFYRKN